jgi:hypothetical protein
MNDFSEVKEIAWVTLGMEVHAYNLRTGGIEAGESRI